MGRLYRSAKENAWGRALGRELQRRRSGQTAEAVAQAAGVPVDTLRRVERGAVASPGFFLVGRIAEVLDVSLDDLLRAAQNTEQGQELS
jgi:transcriptional regulator with XRE-family HTH domain